MEGTVAQFQIAEWNVDAIKDFWKAYGDMQMAIISPPVV